MTMRRLLRGLAVATAAVLGCTQPSGDITIRFWALGREGEVVAPLIRDFERLHPGVHVRLQQIPWTAAHEKLLTGFVGDATPDVAQVGNTWIAEFVTLHAIQGLDGMIAQSRDVSPAGYFPGIWQTNIVRDTVWGVPWYVDTRLLFYRTDILAQAGYANPPTTWDEWLAAMRAIKRRVGNDRYAIFLPTNEWNPPIILGLQAGSPLLKDDGQYGAFSDSAFRRGFEFYAGMFTERLAPVAGSNDVANVYQEFGRGLFAMYITGPWQIGEFSRRLPPELQDKWGTAALPGPAGAQSGVSMAGGSSLVMFKRSQHQDIAWQLIEYLSRPDQQLRFSQLSGDLPARVEAWRDSIPGSGLMSGKYTRAFWEQLQRVVPLPQVPEWELIATRVYEFGEQAVRGGVPPAEVLDRLDREVGRILEKRRWLASRDH